MRTVQAVRYVLPFKQGGSVPALVEADDLGMYVVKLRGAAQGAKALVAELLGGEIGRALGLPVPEIVLVELDARLSDSEPDPEIAVPLERSAGLNLGLDYLPGSITFDPAARGKKVDPRAASLTVLFDAFITNVDRTPRNANLLRWHERLWLIDHGASLFFHHGWSPAAPLDGADDPFAHVTSHVLLPWASDLEGAAATLRRVLETPLFQRIAAEVPDGWLSPEDGFASLDEHRAAYVSWLEARTRALPLILEEATRARARHV
ncbi:MAG: hypothetical protein JWP97_6451 [Labilithrix sp.]|nr:hypothetical protein [Labilithrix sp.]